MANVRLEISPEEYSFWQHIFLSPEEEVSPEEWEKFKGQMRSLLKYKKQRDIINAAIREQKKREAAEKFEKQFKKPIQEELYDISPQMKAEVDKLSLEELYESQKVFDGSTADEWEAEIRRYIDDRIRLKEAAAEKELAKMNAAI